MTKYRYDANGNLIRITTPKGFEIRRKYDADDRLTEERVIDKKNGIDRRVEYALDAAGNVRKRMVLGRDGESLETGFGYDLKDCLIRRINPDGAVMCWFYDKNNKLYKEITPYGYDAETDGGTGTTYVYDKAGNRIRKTDAEEEVCYFYNEKNQLLCEEESGRKKQFTYDRQGGIVEERQPDGIRLFSYNSRHQRTKVETKSGNVRENHYDVENPCFELLENGRRTSFVYHNGELLHEKGENENQSSYHLAMGSICMHISIIMQ